MYLFKKAIVISPPAPPITPERAQEVYGFCATLKTQTEIFTQDFARFGKLEIVWNEINALEAVYDEFGELVTPAIPPEYFNVQNRNKLETSLSSDILDTDLIVADLILYYPTYDSERKYADFADSFEEPLDHENIHPKGK